MPHATAGLGSRSGRAADCPAFCATSVRRWKAWLRPARCTRSPRRDGSNCRLPNRSTVCCTKIFRRRPPWKPCSGVNPGRSSSAPTAVFVIRAGIGWVRAGKARPAISRFPVVPPGCANPTLLGRHRLLRYLFGDRSAAVPDAALPPASMQSSRRRPTSSIPGVV